MSYFLPLSLSHIYIIVSFFPLFFRGYAPLPFPGAGTITEPRFIELSLSPLPLPAAVVVADEIFIAALRVLTLIHTKMHE